MSKLNDDLQSLLEPGDRYDTSEIISSNECVRFSIPRRDGARSITHVRRFAEGTPMADAVGIMTFSHSSDGDRTTLSSYRVPDAPIQ